MYCTRVLKVYTVLNYSCSSGYWAGNYKTTKLLIPDIILYLIAYP